MLSIMTVLSMVTGLFQPVYANGGAGAGGSGGGHVTGDNPGYTVWFDQWGADGQPIQGWNEDSMNNMQARIEGMIGKTMNPKAYGGTRPYLEIYQQAAREALADARARSQTGRARIVGVSSIYWNGGNNMQAAYDSKSNVLRLAGTRSGTAAELPDNTGWSTTYNNGDGATGANWRDWLQQYGVAKAPATNLTMIVWAVAEGEPLPREINLTIKKSNGIPSLTLGNKCYAQDLSGAEYEVHKKADLSDAPLYTLVTDANGNASAPGKITVEPSNPFVYVKEVKAPKGFALDPTVYTVSVSDPSTWTVNSVDMPMNDPVAIRLTKKSADKVENPASLEGAEFTVKYYDGQYTKETLPEQATRTWVIKTLKNNSGKYVTALFDEYKVSGDDFYLGQSGLPTLPLGTITIEETKAPEGYTLENKTLNQAGTEISDGVALFNIEHDAQDIPQLVGGNEYTIEEGVSRGQFNVVKVDSKTSKTLEGAKFKIVNKNNYDVVLKNENDEDLEVIPAGGESNFTFTSDKNGAFTGWTNMLQAGNYAVREIEAPKNYHTAEDVEFAIEHGKTTGVTVSDKEKEPKLGTHAHEFGTGSKLVKEDLVKLEDVANYENVRLGKYNYTTTLVAKGTTEAEDEIVYNNTQEVDVTDYNGELKTVVDVDTTKYGDKELVFYEELVSIENPEYGVAHKVREDKDQTVKVTKIRTTIKDKVDGDNIIDGTKTEQTVIDTISYFGLEVGKKYTATGTLMNKETGLPILVDGQPITKTVEFTATETNGEVEVPFTFNATLVAGRRIVAFESVKDENGIEVGIHADINDMSQTFDVTMKLKLQIAKADKDNIKHFLKGAEFTLFNKDGSVYKDINGKDAIGVTNENGELEMNVVYTVDNEGAYVMETKAPEGYEISTEKYPVKLTGKDTLGVDLIKITVLDEAIIIPPTGVETNPLLFVGIGVVALATLGVILLAKKKN